MLKGNPSQMHQTADEVRNQKQKYESELAELVSTITNDLSKVWSGPAHDAFIEEFNKVKPDLDSLNELIGEFIKEIDRAADELNTVERSLM